jgi:cob(I)alamin adenosyltransferase
MLIEGKKEDSLLYTRGGDKGETGLFGAKRVAKDSQRIEAYGTIDELNSCIGLAIAASNHDELSADLKAVQRILFTAGGDLASVYSTDSERNRVPRIGNEDTRWLEQRIDHFQTKLPRLTVFILPGGSTLSAHLHLARAICRRAERRVVSLNGVEKINPELIPFLNRLSTYLFNLARYANALDRVRDEPWKI